MKCVSALLVDGSDHVTFVACLGGATRVQQGARQHAFIHGLLAARIASVGMIDCLRAVTSREDKRNLPRHECIRDRIGFLSVQTDIENRTIERVAIVPDECDRFIYETD